MNPHTTCSLHSRRHVLAGLSAAALLSRVPSAWSAKPAHVIPGIQLFMVTDALTRDPDTTLHALFAMGYREVEYARLPSVPAADLRRKIEAAGLRCPSAHLGLGGPDRTDAFRLAHDLGAEFVVSAMLPRPSLRDVARDAMMQRLNTLTRTDFEQMADLANRIGKDAQAAGLRYAYHNQNFEFRALAGGMTGYDILLHNTDPALVCFEADCGDIVIGGADPARLFHAHPSRFPLVHLKDFVPAVKHTTVLSHGPEMQNADLGRGQVDSKPIVKAALRSGAQHIFVDQDPPFVGQTSLEAAAIDATYLKRLL